MVNGQGGVQRSRLSPGHFMEGDTPACFQLPLHIDPQHVGDEGARELFKILHGDSYALSIPYVT